MKKPWKRKKKREKKNPDAKEPYEVLRRTQSLKVTAWWKKTSAKSLKRSAH